MKFKISKIETINGIEVRHLEHLPDNSLNNDIEMDMGVQDTLNKAEIEPMKPYLKGEWCECDNPDFLCYPENGACPCGVWKHHVHCKNCGGVTQVG